MTPTEAAALLTIAAAFDNRKPDADTAKAWSLALDGLRFEDCRDAIVAHYRESSEWLMPAMVVAGVRKVRATRVRDFGPFDVPSGLDGPAYLAYIRDVQRRVADGELSDPAELALPAGTTKPRPEIPWADVLLSVDDA